MPYTATYIVLDALGPVPVAAALERSGINLAFGPRGGRPGLAMALGGKAFVTLTGNVSAVQAAIDAGANLVSEKGLLVHKVVIPRPHENLLNEFV